MCVCIEGSPSSRMCTVIFSIEVLTSTEAGCMLAVSFDKRSEKRHSSWETECDWVCEDLSHMVSVWLFVKTNSIKLQQRGRTPSGLKLSLCNHKDKTKTREGGHKTTRFHQKSKRLCRQKTNITQATTHHVGKCRKTSMSCFIHYTVYVLHVI